MILVAAVLLTSCSCSSKKSVSKIQSSDFNELLMFADSNVVYDYPGFVFYEASAKLSKVDSLAKNGVIDQSTFMAVYECFYGDQKTLEVTFDSVGNINYQVIDDVWVEDMVMTPYVPMDLYQAINLLEKDGIAVGAGQPVVLRHQLWFQEPEPRYFFGGVYDCNTVNVYTGIINQPLAEATEEWLENNKDLLADSLVESYEEKDSVE